MLLLSIVKIPYCGPQSMAAKLSLHKYRPLHLLLCYGLLLDDLVREFEGQHVQHVDVSIISSKQKMERIHTQAHGRHILQTATTQQL